MTELSDTCNFADDTTFHACDSNLEDLVNRPEHAANQRFCGITAITLN